MTNIQDILNQIQNSDIAKVGQSAGGLRNIATRKRIYVFYNGKHIETINGQRQARLKYGHMVTTCMRRKRPINGYYFTYSENNDMKPYRSPGDNGRKKSVLVKYKQGKSIKFTTARECAQFLDLSVSYLSNILNGKSPIPKKLENVDKIFFSE